MLSLYLLAVGLFTHFFLGIFVIQPMAAYPGGTTIVYWRKDLNVPFITSPDSIVVRSGFEVSLVSRGIALARFGKPIHDRKILQFGYSNILYLWSTGGKTYQ